jgi:uncharacterized protein (TIGR02266 family)
MDTDSQEDAGQDRDGERRRSLRISIDMLVTYWVDVQDRTESYKVKSLNLSEQGIFIRIETPLALGTEVLLRFRLPGSSDALSVKGEVVWVRNRPEDEDEPAGKGIRFKDLDPESSRSLKAFLEKTRPPAREEKSCPGPGS